MGKKRLNKKYGIKIPLDRERSNFCIFSETEEIKKNSNYSYLKNCEVKINSLLKLSMSARKLDLVLQDLIYKRKYLAEPIPDERDFVSPDSAVNDIPIIYITKAQLLEEYGTNNWLIVEKALNELGLDLKKIESKNYKEKILFLQRIYLDKPQAEKKVKTHEKLAFSNTNYIYYKEKEKTEFKDKQKYPKGAYKDFIDVLYLFSIGIPHKTQISKNREILNIPLYKKDSIMIIPSKLYRFNRKHYCFYPRNYYDYVTEIYVDNIIRFIIQQFHYKRNRAYKDSHWSSIDYKDAIKNKDDYSYLNHDAIRWQMAKEIKQLIAVKIKTEKIIKFSGLDKYISGHSKINYILKCINKANKLLSIEFRNFWGLYQIVKIDDGYIYYFYKYIPIEVFRSNPFEKQ